MKRPWVWDCRMKKNEPKNGCGTKKVMPHAPHLSSPASGKKTPPLRKKELLIILVHQR